MIYFLTAYLPEHTVLPLLTRSMNPAAEKSSARREYQRARSARMKMINTRIMKTAQAFNIEPGNDSASTYIYYSSASNPKHLSGIRSLLRREDETFSFTDDILREILVSKTNDFCKLLDYHTYTKAIPIASNRTFEMTASIPQALINLRNHPLVISELPDSSRILISSGSDFRHVNGFSSEYPTLHAFNAWEEQLHKNLVEAEQRAKTDWASEMEVSEVLEKLDTLHLLSENFPTERVRDKEQSKTPVVPLSSRLINSKFKSEMPFLHFIVPKASVPANDLLANNLDDVTYHLNYGGRQRNLISSDNTFSSNEVLKIQLIPEFMEFAVQQQQLDRSFYDAYQKEFAHIKIYTNRLDLKSILQLHHHWIKLQSDLDLTVFTE